MRPPIVRLPCIEYVWKNESHPKVYPDCSCDHCIKREFQHQREIACPACQKPVKKSQLQDKTIEELNFAKETSIRKKVTKEWGYLLFYNTLEVVVLTNMTNMCISYNKTEDDFDTLDEYNDYLETLENLSTRLLDCTKAGFADEFIASFWSSLWWRRWQKYSTEAVEAVSAG